MSYACIWSRIRSSAKHQRQHRVKTATVCSYVIVTCTLLLWKIGLSASSTIHRPDIDLTFEVEGVPYHIHTVLGDPLEQWVANHCKKAGCNAVIFTQCLLQSFQQHLDLKRNDSSKKSSQPHADLVPVNSFDIFDTVIARNVASPHDIFTLIEERYPFPHFHDLRVHAESQSLDGTFDGIYREFQRLTNLSDMDIYKLKQYEVAIEGNYHPPNATP